MTAGHRLRDLADVIEIIRAAKLESGFGAGLQSFVRAKYAELWQMAQVTDSE